MPEVSFSVSGLAWLAVQCPQQLQLRADKIRHLRFSGSNSRYHRLFTRVRFPVLERVVLDASDENDEKLLEPYLQPALKAFIFYGGLISDAFLEKLQVCVSYVS
jgi:hypothetical protein